MRGIQASDELASKFLDVALNHDKLYNFVFSTPLYDLMVDDGYGNPTHSARHVMTALYNRQKSEPETDYGELIGNVIFDHLRNERYHPTILSLLENLEYHAYAEKNGLAAFSLDLPKIFSAIKESILSNESIYRRFSPNHGSEGMWPYLELFNKRLQGSVGLNIM